MAVVALVMSVTSLVRADGESGKRIVIYVESSGTPGHVIDMPTVRSFLRESIPTSLVVVDSEEFRAAMREKGQKAPVGQSYGNPAERPALFERLRDAAKEVHADGVAVVFVYTTSRVNVGRVIFIQTSEQTPKLDEKVTFDPPPAKTQSALLKGMLRPKLEDFAKPDEPPPAPPTPKETLVSSPTDEPPRLPVIADKPAVAVVPPPPASKPVTGSIALRTFPAGGGPPSSATMKIAVPVSKSLSIVPLIGAGYAPPPTDDQAYIFGGGLKVGVGKGFSIDPSVSYSRFPKSNYGVKSTVAFSGQFGAHANGGPAIFKFSLSEQISRTFWRQGLGPPGSDVWESFTLLETQIRPIKKLIIAPVGGQWVFDRTLVGSKKGVNAVAFTISPYPTQQFFGGWIGYDTGRWMPRIAARHFLYAANAGTGTSVGAGGRLALGTDFVDAILGVFFSDAKGPLANASLETIPVVNVDAGWSF